MAKQKHDTGHQKRLIREHQQVVEIKSPDWHARQLIKRGIRTKTILGGTP